MAHISGSIDQFSKSERTAAISKEQSKGTLIRDTVPVIVASMRGGHRCLAANSSNCKFAKFLSGEGVGSDSNTKTSSVPAMDLMKMEDDERTENGEGSSRTSCSKHQKNICPGCRQGFKLPKYLRAHIISHRCKGKMKK